MLVFSDIKTFASDPSASLRISPAGSDARKTAQVRISPGAPETLNLHISAFRHLAKSR